MEKLTLYCGLQGDGPVYHEINAVKGSYAGMAVTGPERILEIIELYLGLSAVYLNDQERIIQLKSDLDRVIDATFLYYKAYKADPLSVTKRLLHLWDSWQLAGWQADHSSKLPGRMKMVFDLKEIFQHTGSNTAQRLIKIFDALKHGACLPEMTICLIDSLESFPFLYQQLFSNLAPFCEVKNLSITAQASRDTDLGKLQRVISGKVKASDAPPFMNDGTLNILHFCNDLDAANAIFAIQQGSGWNPLIVNTDNGLLNGFHHSHGRPVCQWYTAAGNAQVSQVFFLATAMFLQPVRSSQILAFLSSPFTPFSKKLASKLMEAFSEKPGIGNQHWNDEIEKYLDGIKGTYRERPRTRGVKFWLQNTRYLKDPFDTSFLIEIYQTLETWALNIPEEVPGKGSYQDQLVNLGSLCQHLINSLKNEGAYISEAKFERLQSQLFRDVPSVIREAEARSGDIVPAPGAVWHKSKEILWMNATRIEGKDCLSKYWYQEEKDFFISQGLPLPDESHYYKSYQQGVTRMVMLASKRLVIGVTAKVNGAIAGKPYCLDEWNQLINLKPVTTTITNLLNRIPWKPEKQLTSSYGAIALPKPVDVLKVPKGTYKRETESYSSLEKLFQHPAIWYLQYQLQLFHKPGITIPGISALKGMIADTVVQKVFRQENKAASWWKDNALFEEQVQNQLKITLVEEGMPFLENKSKRFLHEYEKALLHAAVNLKSIIELNGFSIVGTQAKASGLLNEQHVEGYIDLLLEKGGKKMVIDLKWSAKSDSYHESLMKGQDLQLALYASMDNDVVKSGYYMLHEARLLIRKEVAQKELKGHSIRHIQVDAGITTASVIKKAGNSLEYRLKELNRGKAEVSYHVSLDQIAYYGHQDAKNLFPLQESKALEKQPPLESDYDLFFGNIY